METRVSNKEKLYSAKPLTEKQKEKAALKQQSKAASRQARAFAKVAKAAAKNTAVKQKLVVCGLESDEDEQSMRLEISTDQGKDEILEFFLIIIFFLNFFLK